MTNRDLAKAANAGVTLADAAIGHGFGKMSGR